MNLKGRLEKLEAQFVPLPCPACAAGERYIDAMKAMLLEQPSRDFNGRFTQRTRCRWCGHEEAGEARVKDEHTAGLWRVFMQATEEGRLCAPEVEAVRVEVVNFTDAAIDDLAYSRRAELQAIREVYDAEMAVIRARYLPRAPYVCAVEGCDCEHPKREARAA